MGTAGQPGNPGLTARPPNGSCGAPERPTVVPSGALGLRPALPNLDVGGGGLFGTNAPILLRRQRLPTTVPDPQAAGRVLPSDPAWIVALRSGRILLVTEDGVAAPTDLRAATMTYDQTEREGGFMGLAFDPDFATRPDRAHVYYTEAEYGGVVLYRATVSVASAGAGAYVYETTDEVVVLVTSGSSHHYGGDLRFGPDGYLYMSTGEGDIGVRAQSPRNLRGKVLRLDVHGIGVAPYYAIPPDNPWRLDATSASNPRCLESGEDAPDHPHDCPEVYAVGFRNPWRTTFDPANGALWLGDVGAAFEELNLVERGANYGWSSQEGLTSTEPAITPARAIMEDACYFGQAAGGTSVAAGLVYRGSAVPELTGKLLFANFGTGSFFALEDPYGPTPTITQWLNEACIDAGIHPVDLVEDEAGRLFVVSLDPATGRGVYEVVAGPGGPGGTTGGPPAELADTGCFAADGTPAPGLIPYAINSELWSDGLTKRRFLLVPDGSSIEVEPNGDFTLPVGSVLFKEFSWGERRIETRMLVHHEDGDWAGYTYLWNGAGTSAVLQADAATVDLGDGGAPWTIPGRNDCLACHTTAKGRSLGLETRQLNRTFSYAGGTDNQLHTLAHVGILPAALGAAGSHAAFAPLDAVDAPVDERARAYLHTNCSHCHPAPGLVPDFDFDTPFGAMAICNQPTSTVVGGANVLVAPGDPEGSVLVHRMRSLEATRMPALGTARVDEEGVAVVTEWIRSLSGCDP